MSTTKHDLGNNESAATGYELVNTTAGPRYMALTRASSQMFKTERGAIKWLARRGYAADGGRI